MTLLKGIFYTLCQLAGIILKLCQLSKKIIVYKKVDLTHRVSEVNSAHITNQERTSGVPGDGWGVQLLCFIGKIPAWQPAHTLAGLGLASCVMIVGPPSSMIFSLRHSQELLLAFLLDPVPSAESEAWEQEWGAHRMLRLHQFSGFTRLYYQLKRDSTKRLQVVSVAMKIGAWLC